MRNDDKYFISNYNIYVDLSAENGFSYVFNTSSRMLISIKGEITNKENLSTAVCSLKKDEIALLKKAEIIHENFNEDELLLNKINNIKKSKQKLMITIIPTDGCNFKCQYCYQDNARNHVISKEKMEGIIRWLDLNLDGFKEVHIAWFGGEPLLCKDIMLQMMEQINNLCKNHGVAMVSSITTNGYELDIETFKKFVRKRVLYYQITIDGDRDNHNRKRPHKVYEDSYDKIVNNLVEISKLPMSYRFEIGIRINIASDTSKEQIDTFVKAMKEKFEKDKRFVFIWQWIRDWGGKRIENYKDELVSNENYSLNLLSEAEKVGLYSKDLISAGSKFDSCEAFYNHGYVLNYDGLVYKCAMHLNDFENCIGEILDSGVMKINKEKNKVWAESYEKIEGKCVGCCFLPICLSNRCHYQERIVGKLQCLECKGMIRSQIKSMINKNKFIQIGGE